MKKTLLVSILIISGLIVSGCNNDQSQELDMVNEYSGNNILGSNNDNLLVYSGEYLNGLVKSGFIIKGLKEDLILSGNELGYKEKWDIKIPDNMYNWDYYYRQDYLGLIWREKVSLHNKDMTWSFYINTIIDSETSTKSEEQKCDPKLFEGVIKSNTKKIIKNHINIFLIDTIFSKSGPDIEPYKFNNIKACWIDSGMIYEVSLSNNKEGDKLEYMNDIIDSLNFYESNS